MLEFFSSHFIAIVFLSGSDEIFS